MNFLTFVFSLLLILSFGVFAIQEKQSGDRRLRSTYLGHLRAGRKILSKCETEAYNSFGSIPKPTKTKKNSAAETKPVQPPKINPECARLNLWPLIQEGREKHQMLYEWAAKLIKTFYSHALFEDKSRAEYKFLDLFLKKAKEQEALFAMEKLSLGDPQLQGLYYKMLKGTKTRELDKQIGYPSLLDMIIIGETPSKICLSHAHPEMISVFFGPKAAAKLWSELHRENPPPLTEELIEKICSESHIILPDPEIFKFLELGRPHHPKRSKVTWIEEDGETKISLRKNIYRSRSNSAL